MAARQGHRLAERMKAACEGHELIGGLRLIGFSITKWLDKEPGLLIVPAVGWLDASEYGVLTNYIILNDIPTDLEMQIIVAMVNESAEASAYCENMKQASAVTVH